jgi:hypothetical protein
MARGWGSEAVEDQIASADERQAARARPSIGSLVQLLKRVSVVTALVSVLGCAGSQPERGADESGRTTATSRTPEEPPVVDSGALRVTLYGIGPVRAGMSVAEASAALGVPLELPESARAAECEYVRLSGRADGVLLMVENLRIARVDVRSGATETEEGARIGDSDERIRGLYAGRVTASLHKYTEGQYLTVTPASPADSAFRLVFETEGGRVTRYRSGKLPQVEYVEGCS